MSDAFRDILPGESPERYVHLKRQNTRRIRNQKWRRAVAAKKLAAKPPKPPKPPKAPKMPKPKKYESGPPPSRFETCKNILRDTTPRKAQTIAMNLEAFFANRVWEETRLEEKLRHGD